MIHLSYKLTGTLEKNMMNVSDYLKVYKECEGYMCTRYKSGAKIPKIITRFKSH